MKKLVAKKLVTLALILNLSGLAPARAADRPGLVPAHALDRALYVAKSRLAMSRANDYGKMVEVAAYNHAYARNPRVSDFEVMKEVNQARRRYDQLTAEAEGRTPPSLEAAYVVVEGLGAIDQGRFVTPVLKSALTLGHLAHDRAFGADYQVLAQFKVHDERQAAYQTLGTQLARAWDTAHGAVSPGAKKNLDLILADQTHTRADDRADEMLAAEPELARLPGLARLGDAGDATVQPDQVKAALAELETEVRRSMHESYADIRQATERHQRVLDGLESLSQAQARERAEEQAAQAKIQERRLKLENLRNTVYVLSVLAASVSPELGHRIDVVGSAAIQVADAVQSFARGAITGAMLTGNVLGAAMNIVALFGGGGPDGTQLILQEIDRVREDIANVRLEMKQNFALVDQKLNLILEVLDKNFATIQANQLEMRTRLAAIQSAVVELQTGVKMLDHKITQGFEQIAQMSLDQSRTNCRDLKRRHPGARLGFKAFRQCLDQAVDYAVTTSRRISLLETPPQSLGAEWTELALDRLRGKPLESQMDFLMRAARERYAHRAVPAEVLANPVAWTTGADTYAAILEAWPEYSRLVSSRGIGEMLATGESIHQSLATIGQPEFLRQLLAHYQVAEADLRDAVLRLKREREARDLYGYDLFTGAGQAIRDRRLPESVRWRNLTGHVELMLPRPSNLGDFLADDYLKAEQVGVGALAYDWTSVQYALVPLGDPAHFLRSTFRATLRPEGGPELVAVDRQWTLGAGPESLPGAPIPGGATFAASSPDQIAADLGSLRQAIARRFANVREDFRAFIAVELGENRTGAAQGSLGYAARRLDAAKAVLQAYVELGLSGSLARRPLVSASLLGDHGLLDSRGIAEAVLNTPFLEQWIGTESDLLGTRATLLETQLLDIVAPRDAVHRSEPYPFIDAIQSQLVNLKRSRDASAPPASPEEAIASIRKLLGY